jgi:MFS family permease
MAGIDLVLFDILLATCPQRHIASYVAVYQLTTYVATFVAPILGTFLAGSLGYAPALFAGSGLRFLGAVLFVLLGVGVPAAMANQLAERPSPAERGGA